MKKLLALALASAMALSLVACGSSDDNKSGGTSTPSTGSSTSTGAGSSAEEPVELSGDLDYDTVGGMVLSCLRTIPEDGSRPAVQVNGLDIQVEKVEDHRIQSALVRKAAT